MWATSARFLQTIPQPQQRITTVTCRTPSGATSNLSLVSGSWSVQSGQIVRRTAQIVIDGRSAIYNLVSTPGTRFQVQHGFQWSAGNRELVPVITGELSSAATQTGDGTISLSIADDGQRVSRPFVTAYSPATTTTRFAAITAAVTGAISATITSTVPNLGTVGVAQTWTTRDQVITDLATDAGAEAFFQPDGSFLIRSIPTISNPIVWLLKTGPGGTIESFARTRPLDKLYNTVIVTPATTDGSQTWTQVVAQITDTTNPRHPNYIGPSPVTWQSPTLMDATTAATIASTLLTKVQGSTETLQLGAIGNPALDAGDVIQAIDLTDTGPGLVTHIIDSLSGDLVTGSMTVQTRAAAEVLT